jgi:hypothetical protein
MGGGLLQLVAYGAQDAYISGNPQITFWKGLFKRHTNFAMEPFRINFSGQVQWGTKQTALVGRHADLLYSTYVEVTLPLSTTSAGGSLGPYDWNNDQGYLGYNLIKYVEIDIGGQVVDRMYSEFMVLWSQLTMDSTQLAKLKKMLSGPCVQQEATALTYGTKCATDGRQQKMNVLYIPLPFFFTRNPGAALPLIALQYHEVKINVLWNETQFIAGNFVGTGLTRLPQAIQAALYIDYIYLDTEERRRMAQASHEYLIEQTQFNEDKGIIGANNRIDLTFNHPVKELLWVVQPSYYADCRLAVAVERPYALVNNRGANYTAGARTASSTTPVGFTSAATFEFTFTTSGGLTPAKLTSGGGYSAGDVLTFNNGLFNGYASGNIEIEVLTVGISTGDIVTFRIKSGSQSYVPETRLKPFTYDIDPVFDQLLQINGQDRLDRRYGDYYNKVQPYQHHSGQLDPAQSAGAYVYSFALRPEEHQPSGTCNFSRIDTATIVMNMAGDGKGDMDPPINLAGGDFGKSGADWTDNWDVRVYATNYNVLRVMSGMGGLAYSN